MNRKMLFRLTRMMLPAFMLAGAVHAETVTTSDDLQKNKRTLVYVHSRPMVEAMYRQGVALDKKLGLQSTCESPYVVKPFNTTVLAPIDFPDNKQHPAKGAWKARYQIERCGDMKFYNTIFIANPNEEAPPIAIPYYPGTSNANMGLVKDAMMKVLPLALSRSNANDCKEIAVFDMHVTTPAHDVIEGSQIFKGVWSETWTFKVCRQMIDMALTFIPDPHADGTTFLIHQPKKKNFY